MQIKVLDCGYVKLIESWGGGEAGEAEAGIIEAARQSTQGSFRGWERDEKLLAFMFKHGHSTPFEFCGMTIEVQAPIFVFREWHRHRTQCLAGDTAICCVTPTGSSYQKSIKEIFDLKHGGVTDHAPARHKNGKSKSGNPVMRAARRKDPWRTRVLPNCQNRTLRVMDESTGGFAVARMSSVWESGVKPLYVLETEHGNSVRASAEHPFYTRRGWVLMKDICEDDEVARIGKVATHERPLPPSLRTGIGVWTSMMRSRLIRPIDICYLCGKGFKRESLALDHVVPVVENLLLALDERNLKPACESCHRAKTNTEQPSREGTSRRGVCWTRVRGVPKFAGKEMTYDIEVDGPHHNYVANGLVVHNSYNEMSARYAPLPDINYLPTEERLLLTQGGNKQAQGLDGTTLTHESAEWWLAEVDKLYGLAEDIYQIGLRAGVPKELARIVLPVGRYSRMRATANLRNWLGFLALRLNPQAQFEIRQFAQAVSEIIRQEFPRTWNLFEQR